MQKKSLTNEDGEVRPLNDQDMNRFQRGDKVLPPELYSMLVDHQYKKGRSIQKMPTKKHINLRIDEDILNHFKSLGKGWQTMMNNSLREAAFKQQHHQ